MKQRSWHRAVALIAAVLATACAAACLPEPPAQGPAVTSPEAPPPTIETDLDDLVDLRPEEPTPDDPGTVPSEVVVPAEAEPEIDNEGCLTFTLPERVLFAYGECDLSERAPATLRGVAQILLRDYPGASLLIEGHCDATGTREGNAILSQCRADEVARWLVQEGGITATLITSTGRGSVHPIADETTPDGRDDPEGRARNRRVEITVSTAECSR